MNGREKIAMVSVTFTKSRTVRVGKVPCFILDVDVDLFLSLAFYRDQSGNLPRDDAGQFDSNRIWTKKRLAYETNTERRRRGQERPDCAPWPWEQILKA